MSTTLPDTQLAVITNKNSSKLQTLPVPNPGPGEVLIKNVAVASNPKDWKLPGWLPDYEAVEGNDVAGYIVKVGEGVKEYKGGERVAAFSKMTTRDNKYGAYQEYTVAPASTTFPIPENTSFEAAATLPLAVMTAAIGLFVVLGISEPPKPGEEPSFAPDNGQAIIVYGASTSVGFFTTQLAKRAGYFVVGVSGSSAEYAKSAGADVIVDYRGKTPQELEDALISAVGGRPASVAYDAVTLPGTALLLGRVLAKTSPDGKGKVTFVLNVSEEEQKQFPSGIIPQRTMVGTAYAEDEAFASRFYRQISSYLASSPSNPKPFQTLKEKVLPNGLASVEEALALLKADKVHGEKLVYRIAETPGIQA